MFEGYPRVVLAGELPDRFRLQHPLESRVGATPENRKRSIQRLVVAVMAHPAKAHCSGASLAASDLLLRKLTGSPIV